jgi:hypothetical protein
MKYYLILICSAQNFNQRICLLILLLSYRENEFSKALEAAKEIAMEMDISPQFRTKSKIKIKRQFDEGADDATIATICGGVIQVNYFIPIVDQAIASLNRRFEQYQGYEKAFSFFYFR